MEEPRVGYTEHITKQHHEHKGVIKTSQSSGKESVRVWL